MKFGKIDIPNTLLDDLHNNRVVVFAGAGVSMGEPAGLPNFKSLTNKIAKGTGDVKDDSENLEQFLGRLHDRGVKVHRLAKIELSHDGLRPTPLHSDLLRLYRRDQSIRLVTTNFDLLFEQAARDLFNKAPDVFHAPLLPFGDQLNGIIHIHGSICHPDQMVLTDRDFGRAYLREAWATRFLLDLYDKFTFLFVGYRHRDTVMNYLVRSLPSNTDSSHYALIAESDSADHQHWGSLGIELIPYPQHENNHSELNEAISKLATHVQRGMDGWRREISAIAEKHPRDLNEEDEGLIAHALEDETKTRFFTSSAPHPEWIVWLDNHGHLPMLFNSRQLRESDKVLSRWLAGFVFKRAHSLFVLITNHNSRIHPTFWQHIAETIERYDEPFLHRKILSRWISLLLSTAPDEGETSDGGYVSTSECLASIAQRCIDYQMINELLVIFDAMIRSRLSIRDSYCLFGDETEENPQFSVELPLVGKCEELDKLWEKGLRRHLSEIAKPLLERVIWCLKNHYLTYSAWTQSDRLLDPISMSRSAIERHQQDEQRGREESDVLIDAGRDCLDFLASKEPEVAAQWCSRLVASYEPLLRRLAVHSLSQRIDLEPDDKIRWLLEHIDVHDYATHHEVYRAVQHSYPGAGSNCRIALIKNVQSYRFPREEHSDKEEITARVHFDWFYWLHKSDPTCTLAEQALNKVLTEYPYFKPKNHPDFTSWMESGLVSLPRPWTVEEVLEKPRSYSVDDLLSVEHAEEEGPTRAGLIQILSEATRRDFDWSLDLAKALARACKWDVYPWSALISTWGQMELEEHQYLEAFSWLENSQLYSNHSREIADVLYTLVKSGGPSYALQLLPRANQIAEELWKYLDRAISVEVKHGWHNQSANYPVWGLTNFWLSSVSLWRRHQAPAPITLIEDYRRPLLAIIRDSSPIGGLGKSILASRLALLLAVDEEWTLEHLIPLFEPDSPDFQAAWDGFVATGRLSPSVAQALKDLFLNAVTRINTDLYRQRRGFVECYTVMLIYFVDDVLDTWIPKLFAYGGQQNRPANRGPTLIRDDNRTIPEIFALKVTKCLQQMKDGEKQELWRRWLRDCWQNRLYGRPAPLTAKEANLMLEWLPELNTEFPEAVSLAIQMPLPSLQRTRVLACLVANKIWQNHPEAVGELLIYLWKCNIPAHYIDTVPKIIAPLLESNISSELRQKLEEIRIRF